MADREREEVLRAGRTVFATIEAIVIPFVNWALVSSMVYIDSPFYIILSLLSAR